MCDYPISLDRSSELNSPGIASDPRKEYPTLHLHWNKSYDLPSDGLLTVRFHKRKETNTESDDGDSQSVELEILTIEDVKEDKESKPKKSARDEAGDALDRYKADYAGEE